MKTRAMAVAVTLGLGAGAAHAQEAPADDAATASDPATPAPTVTKKKKAKKHKRDAEPDFRLGSWDGELAATGRGIGGALSGRSTLRTRGALIGVAAEATPAIERGRWRLELPFEVGHRETPGAELRETAGGLDLNARWKRSPRLRVETSAGVRAVWRPDWLDEYQPMAGGLGPTDRYGHLDERLEVGVAGIPLRHQHARLALGYAHVDHPDDPNYDPIDAPTHLVPGDHDQVDLDGSWRYLGDGWKAGGGLELARERWFQAFARDAGTGLTHAGAGGPPPNPKYREVTLTPSVAAEVELLDGALELGAGYGYEVVSDRYQGYYSSRAHHPELDAAWKHGKVELVLALDAVLRGYGDGSYAAGGNHPALDDGAARRSDRKLSGRLRGRWAGGARWAVIGQGELVDRQTNFPDYVPGVFPDTRAYDIQWDYTNWEVSGGVELAL